eukprot:355734_1
MTTNNMLNSEYLDWCQVMDDSTMPNHNGWAVLKDNISNLNCPLFSDGSNLSMVVGDGVTVGDGEAMNSDEIKEFAKEQWNVNFAKKLCLNPSRNSQILHCVGDKRYYFSDETDSGKCALKAMKCITDHWACLKEIKDKLN